jgi:hypothetical protein
MPLQPLLLLLQQLSMLMVWVPAIMVLVLVVWVVLVLVTSALHLQRVLLAPRLCLTPDPRRKV